MAWTKIKTVTAIATASLFAVGTTTVIAGKLIQSASHNLATLEPETFVTTPGFYRWANAAAIGELTFRNNKTRSITLGTSAEPPPGTTIVNSWTNAPSESKLTIGSNEVKFVTSDGSHQASTGIGTWRVSANWFIYKAKGMRVWAYDGDRGLWMLTATPLNSECSPIEYLQEQPPAAVLGRLPERVKKMLPKPEP